MMKQARGKSHRGFIKPGFRRVSELKKHGIPHASGPRDNVFPPKDDNFVDSAKPGSRESLSTRNGNPDVGLSSSLEYMNVTPEADAGTFGSSRNCNSSSVCEDRDRNASDQSLASALWDQLVIDSEVKESFQPFSSPEGLLVQANSNVGGYQQHWLHPAAAAPSGCHLNPLDECIPSAPHIQILDVPMCPVYQVMPFPVVAFQHPFYIGFPFNHHGVELNPAYYGQFGGNEYQANCVVAAQLAYNHQISKEAVESAEGQLLESSSDGCEINGADTKPTSSVGEPNERKWMLDHESNPHGSYVPPCHVYTKHTCDKGLRRTEEYLARQRPRVSTSPISSSDRAIITSETPKNDDHCPRNPILSKEKFAGRKKALRFFDSGPVRGKFRPFGQRSIVHRSAAVTATSFNNPRFF